jgi:hypothetical protein
LLHPFAVAAAVGRFVLRIALGDAGEQDRPGVASMGRESPRRRARRGVLRPTDRFAASVGPDMPLRRDP